MSCLVSLWSLPGGEETGAVAQLLLFPGGGECIRRYAVTTNAEQQQLLRHVLCKCLASTQPVVRRFRLDSAPLL